MSDRDTAENAATRTYRLRRDGHRAELRELRCGRLDVLDVLAKDLLSLADARGLPLNPIPCATPGVVTFATDQILPVMAADGWHVTEKPECNRPRCRSPQTGKCFAGCKCRCHAVIPASDFPMTAPHAPTERPNDE